MTTLNEFVRKFIAYSKGESIEGLEHVRITKYGKCIRIIDKLELWVN